MKGAGANGIVPVWEFYDMENDPMEMDNLYGNTGYKEIINQLKSDLLKLKKEYKDEDSKYPQMKDIVDSYYWTETNKTVQEPKDVWFDVDFSSERWLDAVSSTMQTAGKNPYDPRTIASNSALETGGIDIPVTVENIKFNCPVWRDAAPFTSISGETFEYSIRMRANQNKVSYIEFPVMENAGRMVLYVAHGSDASVPNQNNIFIELGQRENASSDWQTSHTWDVPWDHLPNTDVRLIYDINIDEPVALRIQRQKGTFMRIYRVMLGKYGSELKSSMNATASDTIDFKVINRTVYLSKTVTNAKIYVFDISGRQVFMQHVNTDNVSLNNMNPGIYVLKLIAEQGEIIKKIMVQ